MAPPQGFIGNVEPRKHVRERHELQSEETKFNDRREGSAKQGEVKFDRRLPG